MSLSFLLSIPFLFQPFNNTLMIIGKTKTSISIPELFEKYSETEILTTVFPEVVCIPCKIQSPFRKDDNPSFSIYLSDDKHIRFKDFGDSNCKGSLLDLLCKYWNCTFNQVFDKILEVMQGQEGSDVTFKMKQIKTLTRKEASELSKIEVKVRPWQQCDLDYWGAYGISRRWLEFANVKPISHKIITKKDKETGKSRRYIFPAEKLAYCYCEWKEGRLSLKIYQPMNTKGFKWCSSMDASVISLWTKVPEYGDKIVICSSLKDALCLSANLHIPAIAPQGEAYSISETAAHELRRRYEKVFICYDVDAPGLEDSKKLAEQTGFIRIVPDLKGEKDLSDAFKKYGKEWFVKNLTPLFK